MHLSAQRLKPVSIRSARILPAAVLLMMAGCCDDDGVARIEVIPDLVNAVADKQFLMSVRLTNERGQLMPDESAVRVKWSSDPRVTLSTTSGPQTKVTVSSSVEGPVSLTASLGDISGRATITLARPAASIGMDWGTGGHIDGDRPTLVLVDGQLTSEWRSDTLIAFAGGGHLDEFRLSDRGGEVTVFSPGHALQRLPVGWTDNCDLVQMREDPAPVCSPPVPLDLVEPISIPIYIVTLFRANFPAADVQTDLSDARRKLANGWTGLTLKLDPVGIDVREELSIQLNVSAAVGWKCQMDGESSLPQQLRLAGVNLDLLGPGKVTVVYAQTLLIPTASGAWVEVRGYACQWDKDFGTIVLINWGKRAGTSLTHELGHALGSPLTHTNGMVGFDASNVMWSYHYAVPASREILTLGQAFRLSLDGDGFIHQRVDPRPSPQCTGQNQGASEPCPRLAKDVIRQ
jgi:hypothetical protein